MHSRTYYRLVNYFKNYSKEWDEISPDNEKSAIDFAHNNINPDPSKEIIVIKKVKLAKHAGGGIGERVVRESSLEYKLAHFSGEIYNNQLRNGEVSDEINKITKMINSHSNKVPMVLYRGVKAGVFELMRNNGEKVGVDLYEKGFMSCSLLKGHELNANAKLRIYIPAGTPSVYLGSVNNEQFFFEVVIQRGAKLKIVSMDGVYINCKLIGISV